MMDPKAEDKALKLQLGKFYRARDQSVWCVYRIDGTETRRVASAINVDNDRTEYFNMGGRYSSGAEHEKDLLFEAEHP